MLIKNKKGESRWWLISGGPNYNDKGELIGSIGIHLDITDQKRMATDLEKALQEAKDASLAKESFLANMSHEIRTPLNAIIGMIRELKREDLTPIQSKYVSYSDLAANHLLDIVNNVLDLSKIEAGELVLEQNAFNLVSLINMVKSILYMKAEEKKLDFNIKVSPEINPVLIGDGSRIRQVLINILSNAIKFTNKGFVNLDVNVVNANAEFQDIEFIIQDSGIGMSENFLSSVFDKFSQEERHSSHGLDGTGLGMTISREIISLMNGDIQINSRKGIGTIVRINLTLPIGGPIELIEEEFKLDKSLSGLHCLLVEDNELNRLIASKSLHNFGCFVAEAEDGQKAIDLLKSGSYDFILMDIQMPVMDGIETTSYIRNILKLSTPVIALTANAFKKDIDLYLSVGMNDYVTKPFREYSLFEVIVKTLKSKPITHTNNIISATADQLKVLYDLSKIHELSRGDLAFVNKMIGIFIDQTPVSVKLIRQAFEIGDFESISKIVHRIKPSIENMGIVSLSSILRELESESKKEEVTGQKLKRLVNELDEVLSRVINQLKAISLN